ncbi:MAG TPA: NUDIX hydrolase [Solirubrobacteraceae bacterium]|jgi:8-oxo-dGTP pyrophosphatase MutT (NUDIX family)|nr:NUDIX hydrolase [Solirubrobacteraceae bacterium]
MSSEESRKGARQKSKGSAEKLPKSARQKSKGSGSAPVGSSTAGPGKVGGRSGRSAREVSAGGVVVHEGSVLVIVPTRLAADGSQVLALPKGHPEDGETLLQAASREVHEETGVQGELVEELGEVRYWYVRDRRRVAKSVHFFLFRYSEGDIADHDDEVLEVRWMKLAEAQKALSYQGEREMVARALAICQQDR